MFFEHNIKNVAKYTLNNPNNINPQNYEIGNIYMLDKLS